MSTTPTPDVEIGTYLAVLRRRKLLVSALTLAGLASALVYSLALARPVYASHSEVLVRPVLSDPFDAGGAADRVLNMGTERELVKSGAAAAMAGLPRTRLTVTVVGLTEVLDIAYRDTDRTRAQEGAAAFARAYLELTKERATQLRDHRRTAIEAALTPISARVEDARRSLRAAPPASSSAMEAQARLRSLNDQASPYRNRLARMNALDAEGGGAIVSPAGRSERTSPRPKLDTFLGGFFGFFVGLLLANVRDRTDGRLRDGSDLEDQLGAPVLATVPRTRRSTGPCLVATEHPDSPASHAYRALRIRMLMMAERRKIKTVMVASPGGENARTAVAANLAESLAQVGKRVALLPAGALAGDMAPGEIRELLAERSKLADFVVIEAPPALDAANCLALAPLVDGILLVADTRSTTREEVALVREQFDQVGGRVLGGVLSGAGASG